MASADGPVDDLFLPGGRLHLERLSDTAVQVLRESLRLAREELSFAKCADGLADAAAATVRR